MESIGNRLRAAREGQDMSVEDVAHETRIQPIYIRGLENDDYSNFPSTTYAKSFLSLYSRFLEVDADDALEQFAGGDTISLSGQGYLESVSDNIEPRRSSSAYAHRPSSRPSAPRRRPIRENSPGLAPLFLGLVLVVLVIAIPTLWILGKDAQSIDEVVSKAEELTNTKLIPVDSGGPEPAEKNPEPEKTTEPEPATSGADTAEEPEPKKPAVTPVASEETKMAQVTPPSRVRNLDNSPGGATSPVITGEKPKPVSKTVSGEKPAAPPRPPVTLNQGEPLRAVPLIARPLVVPEEGTGSTETGTEDPETDDAPGEDETGDEPSSNGGNQFPRPLE